MQIGTSGPQETINFGGQKVKGQGHTRPKIHLEAEPLFSIRTPILKQFLIYAYIFMHQQNDRFKIDSERTQRNRLATQHCIRTDRLMR